MARNAAGFSIKDLDVGLLISADRIDGVTAIHKRGLNTAVEVTYGDIWLPQGILVVLPTATILEVASSSTDDAAAGTGARTILVEGYDASYDRILETVTLNGQTLVNTTGVYLGVNSVRVITAGSGLLNAGDIYLADDNGAWTSGVPDTANKIQAKINIGYGRAQTTIHTVFAGHTAFLTGLYVNSTPGKSITFRLIADDLDNASKVVEIQGVVPAEGGIAYPVPTPPLAFAEKTTIRLQALVSATTGSVSGGYDLILLDNSKL